MDSALAWLRANSVVATWLAVGSTALLVIGLGVVPLVLVRLREDHFLRPHSPATYRHPLLGWAVLVFRNVVGGVLVLAGLAMLLLPGQGILTLLAGVSLLNFPGKRRFELRLLRLKPVRQAITWVRAKWGRGPLLLPEEEA